MNTIKPLFLMLILSLSSQVQATSIYSAAVLADNPLGYWRLGESVGTTALDSSGNGHQATYMNGVSLGEPGAIAGDNNTAANFDGSDDHIAVNNPAPFQFSNQSVSLEAWVQVPDNAEAYYEYFWLGNQGGSYLVMGKTRSGWNNGGFYFQTGGDFGHFNALSATNPDWTGPNMPKNEWLHLVGVLDFSELMLNLYINGDLIASGSTLGIDLSGSSFSTLFGIANHGTFTGPQKGPMDEIAIYDYALSAEQINTHFQVASGTLANNAIPTPSSLWLLLSTLPFYRHLIRRG